MSLFMLVVLLFVIGILVTSIKQASKQQRKPRPSLPDHQACPACGYLNRPAAQYCAQCGHTVTHSSGADSELE